MTEQTSNTKINNATYNYKLMWLTLKKKLKMKHAQFIFISEYLENI